MTNDPRWPSELPPELPAPSGPSSSGAPESVSPSSETGQQAWGAAPWGPEEPSSSAVVAPPRPVRDRLWLHALLLLGTLFFATQIGGFHWLGYLSDFRPRPISLRPWQFWMNGLWYSATVLFILGAHEMGHYVACRRNRINASLPYFLPAPGTMIGTFGAFIRIRQPVWSKRVLFDIGIAGPIAGFVVAVPALVVGIGLSHVVRVPPDFVGLELGEPLLFQAVSRTLWGLIPEGYSLNLHPMALAAWFGLLATLLNLFPIGQLDGGHIAYAVFGRRARVITLATVVLAVMLTFVSLSWLVWTALMLGMLFFFGPNHPPTIDESQPLDWRRKWLAFGALVIFILCFTPAPIQPLDLIRR